MVSRGVLLCVWLAMPRAAQAAEHSQYEGIGYLAANVLILIGFGVAAAEAASRKGYNYTMWFVVGLVPLVGVCIAWALPRKRILPRGDTHGRRADERTGGSESTTPEASSCPSCGGLYTRTEYRADATQWTCRNCGERLPKG
jgi:hypothetical protein